MAQVAITLAGDRIIRRTLPDPDEELMPGLVWGRAEALFTPAFWATQVWIFREQQLVAKPDLRSGESLAEEVAACLLGGHGIRGELGRAAFLRLRDRGLLEYVPDEYQVEVALREPLLVGGKWVRYRFPKAKAKFLSLSLSRLQEIDIPLDSDRTFRNALLALPGVGMKTASWITRNWLKSDQVAILDVHVMRAGQILGVFREEDRLPAGYLSMESRFLQFSKLLGEPASILDLVIWMLMRRVPSITVQMLRPIRESRKLTQRIAHEQASRMVR
jgi:N-glycosylase/DNA lyase